MFSEGFLVGLSSFLLSKYTSLERLACDEDAEWVECGLKMSVLMPDIINICFTQPATVDLATALWGLMKLTNNWEDWFFFTPDWCSLYIAI